MKNNKGVSIIMLIVTIILMIIIASFAVYYSNNIAPEARLAAQYASLKEVKKACNIALQQIELDPDTYDEFYFFGHDIDNDPNYDEKALDQRCGNQFLGGGRKYVISNDGSDECQRRLKNLELSNITETYVVDL